MSSNLALTGELDKMCEEEDRATTPLSWWANQRNKVGVPFQPSGKSTNGSLFTSCTAFSRILHCGGLLPMHVDSAAPKSLFHSYLLKELPLGHPSSDLVNLRRMAGRKGRPWK